MSTDDETIDDETARKARAERLREQVQRLKDEAAEPASSDSVPAEQPPESPREFIHRKMREVDEERRG